MKITKDEAIILSWGIDSLTNSLVSRVCRTKEEALLVVKTLQGLEERLLSEGKDNRRIGRTSKNDGSNIIRRYCGIPEYVKRKYIKKS